MQAQEKYAEAEPVFRQALGVFQASLESGHWMIGLSRRAISAPA